MLNGGFVQFDSHLVPSSGSYSVSLDFQPATTDNPGITEFISQGSSGGPGFYLGTNGFGFRATDSWGPFGSYDPADPHRLLFSVDSVVGKSYLYLDGTLLDTRSFAITTTTGGTDTRLGSQFAPYGENFHGTLDNVRIFDSAITPDQDTDVTGTPEPSTMMLAGWELQRRWLCGSAGQRARSLALRLRPPVRKLSPENTNGCHGDYNQRHRQP
ncbi:MAG TPA: LamG-like jellyroll fold domain-containing protein [Bryobacteraceae bacterium]